MVRRSRTLGTRWSVSGWSVSSDAASAGRAAFLAPLARTRPIRAVGPVMTNRSMPLLSPELAAAESPAPQHEHPRHAGVVGAHGLDLQAGDRGVPAHDVELSGADLHHQWHAGAEPHAFAA